MGELPVHVWVGPCEYACMRLYTHTHLCERQAGKYPEIVYGMN